MDDLKWHAPGIGEVHSSDHVYAIYCEREDGDSSIVDDELAEKVCELLNQESQLTSLQSSIEAMQNEFATMRADVKEWACEKCSTVYPGPPQEGFACVICPACEGRTMPRSTLKRLWLEKELAAKHARIDALENSVSVDDFIREIEQYPGMRDKFADARKWLADQEKPSSTSDALGDGWISWSGGNCPVPYDSKVILKFRDESIGTVDTCDTQFLNWEHGNYEDDIIAYRVVG